MFFFNYSFFQKQLSDLLIKPVQRLTKYVLLLQTITKQIEQAGLVEDVPIMKEACNVMNVSLFCLLFIADNNIIINVFMVFY